MPDRDEAVRRLEKTVRAVTQAIEAVQKITQSIASSPGAGLHIGSEEEKRPQGSSPSQ
jgi:hypothetical protein